MTTIQNFIYQCSKIDSKVANIAIEFKQENQTILDENQNPLTFNIADLQSVSQVLEILALYCDGSCYQFENEFSEKIIKCSINQIHDKELRRRMKELLWFYPFPLDFEAVTSIDFELFGQFAIIV